MACNNDPPAGRVYRPWERASRSCVADANAEKYAMRRKAETLKYIKNSAHLSKKGKYSQMVRGAGPYGKRVWATQGNSVTDPNTRQLRTNGVGNRQTLICPHPPPGPLPASNSGVPGGGLLELDEDVLLIDYIARRRYAGGVESWPQTRWQPGMRGFPRGKSGSRPDQLILPIFDQLCRQRDEPLVEIDFLSSETGVVEVEQRSADPFIGLKHSFPAKDASSEVPDFLSPPDPKEAIAMHPQPEVCQGNSTFAFEAGREAARAAREAAASARQSVYYAEDAIERRQTHERAQMLQQCKNAHAEAARTALTASAWAIRVSEKVQVCVDEATRFALAGVRMTIKGHMIALRHDMNLVRDHMHTVLHDVNSVLRKSLMDSRAELFNLRNHSKNNDPLSSPRVPPIIHTVVGPGQEDIVDEAQALGWHWKKRHPAEASDFIRRTNPNAWSAYCKYPSRREALLMAISLAEEGGIVWNGRVCLKECLRIGRTRATRSCEEFLLLEPEKQMVSMSFMLISKDSLVAKEVINALIDPAFGNASVEQVWTDAWEEVWARPLCVGPHTLPDHRYSYIAHLPLTR